MPNNDFRAKQFLPFDALTGFNEAIKIAEKDFYKEQFDLKMFKEKDKVTIKYYDNLDYMEIVGIIKKIDRISKIIWISYTKILFDDILEIKKIH